MNHLFIIGLKCNHALRTKSIFRSLFVILLYHLYL